MHPDEIESDELDQMTAVQLKALCKEQGLKVTGKKDELKDRLRDHFLSGKVDESKLDEFDDMSDDQLRLSLAARDLETAGVREDLLARLREDIMFVQELETVIPPDAANGYRTISEALAAAANDGGSVGDILAAIDEKLAGGPKHIDLKITSLRMQPEKYTAGGAPSVTADVLRMLAGDPFEDPPRYGTVSVSKNLVDEAYSSYTFFLGLRLFWWRERRTRSMRSSIQSLCNWLHRHYDRKLLDKSTISV